MIPSQFEALVAAIPSLLPEGMGFTAYGAGEESDFVRFNHAKVRQSGSVSQGALTLRVIDGRRHATTELGLSADLEIDQQRLASAIGRLLETVACVPEDPHLLLSETVENTHQSDPTPAPDAFAITNSICAAAEGTDFVGIYAGGRQWRAFANHLGQRNWFDSTSFLLDYSLVHSKDKAVKTSIGGKQWSDAQLAASIAQAKVQLEALDRPSRTIPPGSYRAYLTPAAVAEIFELVGYGGFSAQAQQLKVSMLHRLAAGEASLSAAISVTEQTDRGLGPQFTPDGFIKPGAVPLIAEGASASGLISPRSAVEFGLEHNGSDASEFPRALSMSGGDLDATEALERLGTGVWVSNLWYLNHSDKNAARFTGMTRFATFWVEDGKLVAPLDVMRFDATLYDLFGDDLEALTATTELMPSASTYESRSTDFIEVPGALVKALPFTL
ncbi:MAG: TldD/PmbA family protein [Proteobacteria bacterium]|nr:TldD/PmbA family protein [Pseudomonadota bacterium]